MGRCGHRVQCGAPRGVFWGECTMGCASEGIPDGGHLPLLPALPHQPEHLHLLCPIFASPTLVPWRVVQMGPVTPSNVWLPSTHQQLTREEL